MSIGPHTGVITINYTGPDGMTLVETEAAHSPVPVIGSHHELGVSPGGDYSVQIAHFFGSPGLEEITFTPAHAGEPTFVLEGATQLINADLGKITPDGGLLDVTLT